MVTVKVYGEIKNHTGRGSFKASIQTAAEAVRFLVCNFPGLRQVMADGEYALLCDRGLLHMDELHYPIDPHGEIKLVPVIGGAGGSTGQILFGAALIGLSFVSFGAGTAFAGAGGATGMALFGGTGAAWGSSLLFAVGASMVLGGVSQLIAPTIDVSPEEVDATQSFSFSGIQQNSRMGVAVPIVYGRRIVGSHVVSTLIETSDD